jgi:glycosyltransferase involved in cell wall biosynthesis
MRIRVAYDTTVLVNEFKNKDRKSGIFRETEEIMNAMSEREDIELILSYFCAGKRSIFGSLNFLSYIQSEHYLRKYSYLNTLKSRFGLEFFYEKYYRFRISKDYNNSSNSKLNLIGKKGVFKLLSFIDAYHKIDEEEIDIIHSTYHKLPSKKFTKNIPRVLTIQDLIPVLRPELVGRSLNTYFKSVLKSVDLKNDWIICISEYTRQEFCEYTGFPSERTFVTPLAAANHFYRVNDPKIILEVRNKYCIHDGNYFLSLATHLAPHKNLIHLIRCFFKLIMEQPNLDVNLVLAGSKRHKLEEIIDDASFPLELSSRIIYTGYVADEDLSALYSGASAFIFPSLYEGFGLPPLEAMQCGTPVITSNVTSLPEVVGNAGIMVNPKDEDELCQAMLKILTNSDLCQELKHKGLMRSQNFSWSKCADDTVEVYKKVLSSQ